MLKGIKWEDVYQSWKSESWRFYEWLSSPMPFETIFVEYNIEGYIYGYDWLENTEAMKRKSLIEKNPTDFLYFTKPTNKGTIQTAGMLVEAQDEEEIAAIWFAATAKELCEYYYENRNEVKRYAELLYTAACDFLKNRYGLWHHAMKNLVPNILLPSSVINNIVCKDVKPVIGLILMNSVLLKNNWKILRYSSLLDDALPGPLYRI